ncbi:MAG: hypothetical protein AB7O80_05180 [Acetobacteraceae bacterium]
MPSRLYLYVRLALAALLLPTLAACGPRTNEFAPLCPEPGFLQGLADLVRYRPGSTGRDLTDITLRGRLASIRGECQAGSEPGLLDTTLVVTMDLIRGPALENPTVIVPVFVYVGRGQNILNKQVFPIQVTFPSNVDRMTVATPPIVMAVPVSGAGAGAGYDIIAGFQLTPEELQNNRLRGF